jgi:hypothetical protein
MRSAKERVKLDRGILESEMAWTKIAVGPYPPIITRYAIRALSVGAYVTPFAGVSEMSRICS